MKDYHVCSLDGADCNTDDCNTCEKVINIKVRQQNDKIFFNVPTEEQG